MKIHNILPWHRKYFKINKSLTSIIANSRVPNTTVRIRGEISNLVVDYSNREFFVYYEIYNLPVKLFPSNTQSNPTIKYVYQCSIESLSGSEGEVKIFKKGKWIETIHLYAKTLIAESNRDINLEPIDDRDFAIDDWRVMVAQK